MLKLVDKSTQFKQEVDINENLAYRLNLTGFFGTWKEQSRLVFYFIGNWYSTDSYVGYRVYFLDDEPVAVTSQMGRKCDEDFEWVSKEAYNKVREYVKTFRTDDETEAEIDLVNMDEEISEGYKIEFNTQLFDYHKKIPLLNGEKVEIIELEKIRENFGTDSNVKIKTAGGEEKWINIRELIFPYNLKKL